MPSFSADWAPAIAPGLEAFFALDAEADERADLRAELDCLVAREVAEVLHLDLARGVLVDGERVDDADRVGVAELLELSLDLSVEVGMAETEDEKLHRADGHVRLLSQAAAGPLAVGNRGSRMFAGLPLDASRPSDTTPSP